MVEFVNRNKVADSKRFPWNTNTANLRIIVVIRSSLRAGVMFRRNAQSGYSAGALFYGKFGVGLMWNLHELREETLDATSLRPFIRSLPCSVYSKNAKAVR